MTINNFEITYCVLIAKLWYIQIIDSQISFTVFNYIIIRFKTAYGYLRRFEFINNYLLCKDSDNMLWTMHCNTNHGFLYINAYTYNIYQIISIIKHSQNNLLHVLVAWHINDSICYTERVYGYLILYIKRKETNARCYPI